MNMAFKALLYLSLFFIIAFSFSCKTTKVPEDLSTLTKEIEMTKNPCFGRCPSYVLTIYKGGIMTYDGKKFVPKYGLYTKVLSKSAYNDLKKAFNAANFWALDDNYPSNIPDLPKTRISHVKDGKTKTVVGDINRPKVVKDLEKQLETIGESEGWTLKSVPNLELPDYVIPDELVISLKRNIDVKDWLKKYESWNMEIKNPISEQRNLWLFKFSNPDLNSAQVMNHLSMDEDVIVLEFNKKLENRKRE